MRGRLLPYLWGLIAVVFSLEPGFVTSYEDPGWATGGLWTPGTCSNIIIILTWVGECGGSKSLLRFSEKSTIPT